MKKIVMILESGEEVFCGFASSVYTYLFVTRNEKIVPMNGNREYALIRNLYCEERKQFVIFKSV